MSLDCDISEAVLLSVPLRAAVPKNKSISNIMSSSSFQGYSKVK